MHARQVQSVALIALIVVASSLTAPARAERCGTARVLSLQRTAGAPAARPAPGTFQIGSTHFIVHYDDAALASYAQNVSDAAELSWRVLVDTLQYNVPPGDGGAGGDGRTDLYVRPAALLGGAWGVTYPETTVGSPYTGSSTSWVELSDTLSFDRRRVVTTHEVFHVIQVGYDAQESVSFLEMISTWAEDRVYDDVNLYLEVLPLFFGQPQKGLYTHTYSNVPWMIYLTENFGDGILLDIVQKCGETQGANVTAATNDALAPHASSQFEEFKQFTIWNFFTGARDDGLHYSEGATFPLASLQGQWDCYPFFDFITPIKMNRLGSNYYLLDGNGATDALRVVFQPEWFATSALTVNRFKQGSVITDTYTYATFNPADSLDLADWSECDSVLFVYQIETSSQQFNSAGLSSFFTRTPAPADPYVLVLDRDACRAPFDGDGDEFSARDGEETPFTAALTSLGFRTVQSDSIPGDLSMCGGVFVIGGHDGAGTTLTDAEFTQLMAFMDGGGDVYVEGNEFGRWAGSGTAGDFWGYFGCAFTPGETMATGNVSSWSTDPGGPLGSFAFTYDYQDDPDDNVGVLEPAAAETLAVDQSGTVRMSVRSTGASTRVMSTVLLGGSSGAGNTRDDFVGAVIDLFDSIVSTLAVQAMRVYRDGDRVHIEGEIAGYGGEELRMQRVLERGSLAVEVPVAVTTRGDLTLIHAVDDPPNEVVVYRLVALGERTGEEWLLWQQRHDAAAVGQRPLAFVGIHPNPSRGSVALVVESDRASLAAVRVYNVAGQLVYAREASIFRGVNTIAVADEALASLASGVYFVRVAALGRSVERKLHILR